MLRVLLDILFPRHCLVCDKRLDVDERPLCLMCAMQLPRLDYFAEPETNVLAKSFYGRVHLERVASLLQFIPHSGTANLVYSKYVGNATASLDMGRVMAQEALPHGFFDGIDCIVPLPVTSMRRLQRGYNQSGMLAQGVSSVTGIPIVAKAVVRILRRANQASKSFDERETNVKDSFCITDAAALAHRHVLLVDDVITSGNTIVACASMMKRVPGCRVSVLTLGSTLTM